MILKNTMYVLLFLTVLWLSWYIFEFINPWIGIIAAIIVTALTIDKIILKIKQK